MDPQLRKERPIGYLIHDVSRLLRRHFEDEARAHGVTLPQWRALGVIYSQDTITQVALANIIDTDPMTISGILDRLEKRGLIERYPHPTDSRAKLSRLTPAGVELVITARHVGGELYKTAVAGLSDADKEAVISALTLIRDNLSNLHQVADEKEAV